MTPLNLVRLTPFIDRTSGRPELTIGLGEPLVMIHPELANQPRPRDPWKRERCLYSGQQYSLFARHLCSWNSFRETGINRSGDLSQRHPAGAVDKGNGKRQDQPCSLL